ncbi:hypothetical protein BDK51DRAFT_51558 [Blyttiomyces helicus]|uniref:Uncharacterized protein n=1 Tax=Blyttiomyces helicus TaxID=388810 RepID=A0A4P9WF06_9FUNG|nr:hypothetical protein BDK51DRAFT_51558 [Blyttiomyces helicus]|eukprot:RKO89878.1 hypothetical protein BDK51DRAFT_51558 [Blyttiomyces helicus]
MGSCCVVPAGSTSRNRELAPNAGRLDLRPLSELHYALTQSRSSPRSRTTLGQLGRNEGRQAIGSRFCTLVSAALGRCPQPLEDSPPSALRTPVNPINARIGHDEDVTAILAVAVGVGGARKRTLSEQILARRIFSTALRHDPSHSRGWLGDTVKRAALSCAGHGVAEGGRCVAQRRWAGSSTFCTRRSDNDETVKNPSPGSLSVADLCPIPHLLSPTPIS